MIMLTFGYSIDIFKKVSSVSLNKTDSTSSIVLNAVSFRLQHIGLVYSRKCLALEQI